MSRPHLLVEDSRPSLESAVNGFYKQLLTEKRLSSKQCTFLKELVHFPMRMVLFNVSPLKTRICVSVGKCPHGLGENRAGGVGGGAEGLAQGMPTGPPGGCPRARQEVVLGFRVFEGQVTTWPGGTPLVWSWSALSPGPCVLVESYGSPPPVQWK